MRKLIGGAIAVIIDVIFLAFTYWNAFETALTKLRSKGSVGVFLADFITSPTIQVVLFLVAVSLFVWAIVEFRRPRNPEHEVSQTQPRSKSEPLKQTMTGSPNAIQAGRDVKTTSEKNHG